MDNERTVKIVKAEMKAALKELKQQKKAQKKPIKKLLIVCLILDFIGLTGYFLMYGPFDYVRNIYVTTAMKTMSHQYLAYVFFSKEQVEKIMSNNYYVELDDNTNTDDIVIDTKEKKTYKNKYEKELLTRDSGNDLYKILDIKVGNSKAYLVAIYDPTKVKLIAMKKFGGKSGEKVITMCKRYSAVVCINGGGFVDNGYGSGIPLGYVIENGKITWSDGGKTNIIGMTDEGKLMLLSDTTGEEAIKKGVTSGMTFEPFLIVNGKSMKVVGDPWGKAPRIAIAQRKDGVLMFLAVDGENYINGASLQNVIDTLKLYGAYNAANLDGGQSTTLIVDNKLYNNPPAAAKSTSGRYVVTGWGLIP